MKSVKLFKVHVFKSYMAIECGVRWFTKIPSNDCYSYSEVLEEREVELPEGFDYDAETNTFRKNGTHYELVNDNIGGLFLVSSEEIVILIE